MTEYHNIFAGVFFLHKFNILFADWKQIPLLICWYWVIVFGDYSLSSDEFHNDRYFLDESQGSGTQDMNIFNTLQIYTKWYQVCFR